MAKGKRTDLTGRVFGNLTVLSGSYRDNFGHMWWQCRCNCGTEVFKPARNLLSGKVRSCSIQHRYGGIAWPDHDGRKWQGQRVWRKEVADG
ncbi:MAG TPA: hypothetical protein VF848_04235 [Steroidobacteraceae bacterium]